PKSYQPIKQVTDGDLTFLFRHDCENSIEQLRHLLGGSSSACWTSPAHTRPPISERHSSLVNSREIFGERDLCTFRTEQWRRDQAAWRRRRRCCHRQSSVSFSFSIFNFNRVGKDFANFPQQFSFWQSAE